MECRRCSATIAKSEARNSAGDVLCEDCYIESLYAAKPVCNPWQEYLSTRTSDEGEYERKLKNRNNFKVLLETALGLGATDVACLPASQIEVSDAFATLCETPKCENFGTSFRCPPNVSGPKGFRKRIKEYSDAIVFQISVPSEIMYSHQRIEIFRLLHEIGSSIENSAKEMGYEKAKAYAVGSCKKLFCSEHENCSVLSGGGECRNSDTARQSMSGFGINVKQLIDLAGWKTGPSEMRPVCGMVLID